MATRQSGSSAASGGKKLVIKVKSKPALPPAYLDKAWGALERALVAVRSRQPAEHGHQELYSMVEDLCLHRLGGELYVRLYNNMDEHLAKLLSSFWLEHSNSSPSQFLEHLNKLWQEFVEQMKATRLIFTVLDRSPISMTQTSVPSSRSLWDMGLQLFQLHVKVKNPAFIEKILGDILQIIQEERTSGDSFTTAHHHLIQMLSSLGIYSTDFEPKFIQTTTNFYTAESNERLQTSTVPDYLQYCERRLEEEQRRAFDYLDASTRRPLNKLVEQKLVATHAQSLLDKGLDQLLDDEARLLDLKPKGLTLVMDEENPDLIGNLLDYKIKIDKMLSEAFDNDPTFVKATRDAFESFLNSRDNKPAELMAKYADKALRATSSTDSYAVLQKTMGLFRYLHAKDVFEEFYKQALAKRLLLGTSSSNDLEKMMISTLKSDCGASFTNKLEGMLRDIELGKNLTQEWLRHQELAADGINLVETVVQVLSMGFWPTFPDSPVTLPPHLSAQLDRFKQFYTQKHQGRVLHWVNSMGHCIVRAQMPKGRWELEVSLFQAVVLMQFNNGVKALSFKEIADATSISLEGRKEQRVLVRVSKGTTPSLNTDSGSKDDDDDDSANTPAAEKSASKYPHLEDVYQVNPVWTSKKFRLKINQVQIKETKKENEDAHKRVANDRQYQIDATIVRIMKARKQLAHTLLITELFKQLPFPAKPQDLKKRIESLIEREYLERDENDPNQYTYLA